VKVRAVLIFALVGACAAGCSAGAGGDKAGASTAPVVLRMAYGFSSLEYEPAVDDFAARVRQLSHGRMVVRVVSEWGHEAPGYEQQIVGAVADGRVDLGVVGTRVFDTVGVHSFAALTAPMLIDDYGLERAVLASPIPRRMLGGLAPLGVSGLAVLGDGLAKPVGVRAPLLGPATWRGVRFAAIRSDGHAEAVRALGAGTSDTWGASLLAGVGSGHIGGFERSLRFYRISEMQDAGPYVTANVSLWPQTTALLANPDRLRVLSETQRRWLREAAEHASAGSTDRLDRDDEEIRALCRDGTRLESASRGDLAALRRAFAPVYERLQRDPVTRESIVAITRLKRTAQLGTALPVPPGCGIGRAAVSQSKRPTRTDPAVLNGVYRVSWSETELRAAGTSDVYARDNRGVLTLTFRDGRYRVHFPPTADCVGDYRVSGRALAVAFELPCRGSISARWSLRGHWLDFDDVHATDGGDRVLFGVKPWRKIG
jgi:TRAP-type transport system periplasmic protein